MPELRKNELTGEWVSIAKERANRPSSYKGIGLELDGNNNCPFCKHNEHLSTPELYKSKNGKIRIIENKYPIVTLESKGGFGVHDVLIDTDIHDQRFCDLSADDIAEILLAIKIRLCDIEKDSRIKYIQVFKNNGVLAGASQAHSHWQIVGLPIIPFMQENIYKNCLDIYKKTNKCYICDNILKDSSLDIYENDCFKAYGNYASRFSHEINIAPKTHYNNFHMMDESLFISLADILKKCLFAINTISPDTDYNICFMNSFVNSDLKDSNECMHFFIQILPRRGYLAGLELSTSCYINCIPPEESVQSLRKALEVGE